MKVIIAPGAFKNSLKATEVADAIERGLRRSGLDSVFINLPIADGGNGTLDVILTHAKDGKRQTITVKNPLGRPVKAAYGLIESGRTAVIEMALASGMELLSPGDLNPMRASSYGTGQLIKHAFDSGARRFIVGLGGSATVDGASGCLMALGVKFYDASGKVILQQGGGMLDRIATVDFSDLDEDWHSCEILVAGDVDNPPVGDNGAAAVFGPQKGARDVDIVPLDRGLAQLLSVLDHATGRSTLTLKGGGAAGAMAAGLVSGLGATLVDGSEFILEHIGLVSNLEGASLLITGEGYMDTQTLSGKGPLATAVLAQSYDVPSVAFVGGMGADDSLFHDAGLTAVLPIVNQPMSLEEALANASMLVERAALRLGYLLQLNVHN